MASDDTVWCVFELADKTDAELQAISDLLSRVDSVGCQYVEDLVSQIFF